MPHTRHTRLARPPWWRTCAPQRRSPQLAASPNPDLPPCDRFTPGHWSQRTFIDELKHRAGQLTLGLRP